MKEKNIKCVFYSINREILIKKIKGMVHPIRLYIQVRSCMDRNSLNAINANWHISTLTYVGFIKYSWVDIYVRRIYGRVTIAKLPQRAKS